jgi:hypothetical protein
MLRMAAMFGLENWDQDSEKCAQQCFEQAPYLFFFFGSFSLWYRCFSEFIARIEAEGKVAASGGEAPQGTVQRQAHPKIDGLRSAADAAFADRQRACPHIHSHQIFGDIMEQMNKMPERH